MRAEGPDYGVFGNTLQGIRAVLVEGTSDGSRGESAMSKACTGSGPGVPPAPTAGLTASPGGGTGVNVGWAAVSASLVTSRIKRNDGSLCYFN